MREIVSMSELEATSVELLPSRETLALFNFANVTAVNLAIAVNAASIGSAAVASREPVRRRDPDVKCRTQVGALHRHGSHLRAASRAATTDGTVRGTMSIQSARRPGTGRYAATAGRRVRLLGEYQGSGFTTPHYLIARGDGQVLHVSRADPPGRHAPGCRHPDAEQVAASRRGGVRPRADRRGARLPAGPAAAPDGGGGRPAHPHPGAPRPTRISARAPRPQPGRPAAAGRPAASGSPWRTRCCSCARRRTLVSCPR